MAGEGSVIESDGGAGGNLRARRFDEDVFGVIEQESDGVDFSVQYRHGFFVPEHAIKDGSVLENGNATGFIHLGEQIAGHGGFLDFLPAVAPLHLRLDEGAEHSESGRFQALFGFLFMTGLAIIRPPDGFAHVIGLWLLGSLVSLGVNIGKVRVWCMVYGVWCMVYGVWCMVAKREEICWSSVLTIHHTLYTLH